MGDFMSYQIAIDLNSSGLIALNRSSSMVPVLKAPESRVEVNR